MCGICSAEIKEFVGDSGGIELLEAGGVLKRILDKNANQEEETLTEESMEELDQETVKRNLEHK